MAHGSARRDATTSTTTVPVRLAFLRVELIKGPGGSLSLVRFPSHVSTGPASFVNSNLELLSCGALFGETPCCLELFVSAGVGLALVERFPPLAQIHGMGQ